MRPFTSFSLGAVTATAMCIATFGQTAFGVLASNMIEEFDVERWQIGLLVTAMGFTGAFLSPLFGRVTDRIGSVRSTVWVLVFAMISLSVVITAPSYLALLAGALIFGVPNGWTNPATNALVVDNIAAGARGVVTGIKQSGVQVGAFLGGLLLPFFVSIANWRLALGVFLVVPVAGLVGMWRRPAVIRHAAAPGSSRAPVPRAVKWIAVYGALTGLGVSATVTFLPLFAEEDQGWTTSQAGFLIASVGLVAIISRITWGSASERWLGHGRTLRVLAGLSTVAAILMSLVAADAVPGWALLPAALLFGAGASAWNAVGMLAIMDYSSTEMVGRGTGVAMLGFLTGVGLGAPLMGLSVDRLGTYTPGWIVLTTLFTLSAVVAGRIHRTGTLAHV